MGLGVRPRGLLHTHIHVPVGKKTPGGAETHTGHSGAHGHTNHTDKPVEHCLRAAPAPGAGMLAK